jgi:hypothetical protein
MLANGQEQRQPSFDGYRPSPPARKLNLRAKGGEDGGPIRGAAAKEHIVSDEKAVMRTCTKQIDGLTIRYADSGPARAWSCPR